MKGRESGMPDEEYWNSFFDAEAAVAKLFSEQSVQGDLVEFGCGYGTFTVPAARRTTGMVTALDIEPEMLERLQKTAQESHLSNLRGKQAAVPRRKASELG